MADNVNVTAGTGTAIAADEVSDGTLGSVKVQYVKLMDGTLDGTTKATVGANGLKVDGSAVTQPVSIASVPSHAVTNAGTFAVQAAATLAAETTKVIGTVNVAASQTIGLAAGSATIGSAKLTDGTTTATVKAASTAAVATDTALVVTIRDVNANGQATMANSAPVTLPSDSNGPYSATANFVSGVISTAMTSTTSTSLVAAPGASLRNYITQITVSNSHATVGTDILIQDGSSGTTLYVIPAAAVYGGAVVTFPVPLRQPTTNTALYCANVTTGASTKVSASGYKGA